MSKNNEKNYKDLINPIQILKDKHIYSINRYDSFNKKLNFNLTLLTILSSVFVFIFGNNLSDIKFIFKYNWNNCLEVIIYLIITIIIVSSILIVLILLILIFKEILKALEPIKLSELDFESIDLFIKKKYDKAFKAIIEG